MICTDWRSIYLCVTLEWLEQPGCASCYWRCLWTRRLGWEDASMKNSSRKWISHIQWATVCIQFGTNTCVFDYFYDILYTVFIILYIYDDYCIYVYFAYRGRCQKFANVPWRSWCSQAHGGRARRQSVLPTLWLVCWWKMVGCPLKIQEASVVSSELWWWQKFSPHFCSAKVKFQFLFLCWGNTVVNASCWCCLFEI